MEMDFDLDEDFEKFLDIPLLNVKGVRKREEEAIPVKGSVDITSSSLSRGKGAHEDEALLTTGKGTEKEFDSDEEFENFLNIPLLNVKGAQKRREEAFPVKRTVDATSPFLLVTRANLKMKLWSIRC
jgi:hypothetical protein